MKEEKNGNLSVIVSPSEDVCKSKREPWWRINKQMLPYKLHFFLFIGGMGAILPYQSAMGITRYALTAGNLAVAYTTQQFLFLLLKPGIGYLTDYFNKLKATIIGLTIIQAICCLFMILIPQVHVEDLAIGTELKTPVNYLITCDLCHNYQEFRTISSTLPVDNYVFKHSIACFENFRNNSKTEEIHCTKQTSNGDRYISFMYKVTHRTCSLSYTNDRVLSNNASTSDLKEYEVFLVTFQHNESVTVHFLCLHTQNENSSFAESKFTLRALERDCYSVPGYADLEKLSQLHSPPDENISCDSNRTSITSLSSEEYNALLSAANFRTYQFWLFMLFLISSCTCNSCIFTMGDTACYEGVHKEGGGDYGQTRMWGAISWGLIAPFAGFLNDYTENYFASWCLMVVFCSLQIWNLCKMDLIKPDFTQSILKDLKTVFSSMEFIAFEIGVFMNGFCTGLIWFYLTWFIVSIGGNKLVIGLAHTVQCFLGEVPFMFFSSWMIKKLGHFNLVTLALFSHAVRFFIYSYVHNPWWILPVECSHGFTFGAFYSAMTSYGKLKSKPGTEATTQSVLCTTYEGLGAGIGCVVSGICFDHFGGHTTFFYAAFIGAVATGINLFFTFMVRCGKKEQDIGEAKPDVTERY